MASRWAYLSDWSPAGALPYDQWLSLRELNEVKLAISHQTLALIGTGQELKSVGYSVVGSVDAGLGAVTDELRRVSDSTAELRSSIRDLDSTTRRVGESVVLALHVGFQQVVTELRSVSQRLDALVDIGERPAHYGCWEQIRRARDRARNGFYDEALTSLNLAERGASTFVGDETEYRIYLLRGAIYLGDSHKYPNALTDPEKAFVEFKKAARYAQPVDAQEAGRALILAGRAAFVQRKLKDAEAETRAGLQLAADESAGLFQLARLLFLADKAVEGAPFLERAFIAEPSLSIEAATLPEFNQTASVRKCFELCVRGATAHHGRAVADFLVSYRRDLERMCLFSFHGYAVADLISTEIAGVQR